MKRKGVKVENEVAIVGVYVKDERSFNGEKCVAETLKSKEEEEEEEEEEEDKGVFVGRLLWVLLLHINDDVLYMCHAFSYGCVIVGSIRREIWPFIFPFLFSYYCMLLYFLVYFKKLD